MQLRMPPRRVIHANMDANMRIPEARTPRVGLGSPQPLIGRPVKTRQQGRNVTQPRHHLQVLEAALGSAARTRIMQRFRQQAGPRVLLASDVATRGLDVPDITHVVGARARHKASRLASLRVPVCI